MFSQNTIAYPLMGASGHTFMKTALQSASTTLIVIHAGTGMAMALLLPVMALNCLKGRYGSGTR